jgi:hypothetical protein
MAASKIYSAICTLVRECDSEFLKRVAEDYNLPAEELRTKYLESADNLLNRKRKAAAMVDGEAAPEAQAPKKSKDSCQGITSKKEPCKFSALKGGCYCKRHQKAHEEAQAGVTAPVAPKAAKVPKPVQAEPIHDHPIDSQMRDDCRLCQSHGPVFGGAFELEEASFFAPPEDPSVTRDPNDNCDEGELSDAEFPLAAALAPVPNTDAGFVVLPEVSSATREPFGLDEEEFSDAEFPQEAQERDE